MKSKKTDIILNNKIFILIGAATGTVLLVPLIAMQFSNDVDWRLFDFIFMGALLFGAGSAFVLAARRIRSTKQRIIVGLIILAALLLIWTELAVGILGTPLAGS